MQTVDISIKESCETHSVVQIREGETPENIASIQRRLERESEEWVQFDPYCWEYWGVNVWGKPWRIIVRRTFQEERW